MRSTSPLAKSYKSNWLRFDGSSWKFSGKLRSPHFPNPVVLESGFPSGLSRTGSQVAATAKQKSDELSVGLVPVGSNVLRSEVIASAGTSPNGEPRTCHLFSSRHLPAPTGTSPTEAKILLAYTVENEPTAQPAFLTSPTNLHESPIAGKFVSPSE